MLHLETVIVQKSTKSSTSPTAIHLATSVQKLDKAIHLANHFSVRVSDLSGGSELNIVCE